MYPVNVQIDIWSALISLNIVIGSCLTALTLFMLRKPTVSRHVGLAVLAFQIEMLIWTAARLLRYQSIDPDTSYFWQQIGDAAGCTFGPVWLALALAWSGRTKWLSWPRLPLMAAPGVLLALGALTNNWHWLFIAGVEHRGGIGGLVFSQGPLYWVDAITKNVYIFLGFLIFAMLARKSSGWLPRMCLLILGVGIVPVLTDILRLARVAGITQDLTHLEIAAAATICALFIVRHWMSDVVRAGLTQAADQMGDAILVIDTQERVIDANRACSTVLRLEQKDVLGRPILQVLAGLRGKGDSASAEPAALISTWRGEPYEPIHAEVEVLGSPERTYRMMGWPIQQERHDGADLLGHVVSLRDVTQWLRAEGALAESEARFRTLIENSSDLVLVIDRAFTITYVSPSVRHILGYEPHEYIGLNGLNLVHEEDRPAVIEAIEAPETEGTSVPVQFRAQHKNGSWLSFEAVGTDRRADTAVGSIVVNIRDITQRKVAEEALRASEARYRDLFDNATDIVFTLDLEGYFTSLNKAGESLTGYSLDDGQSIHLSQVMPPDQQAIARRMIAAKMANPTPTNYELQVNARDGRPLLLEVSSQAIRRDGKMVGVQGIARDVTEARAATKQLGQMVAGLESVQATTLSLNSQQDIDGLLRQALQGVRDLAGPTHARILLLDREGRSISLLAEMGNYGRASLSPTSSAPCALISAILKHHQPRFVEDVDGEGAERCSIMTKEVQAYCAVPLCRADRAVGILLLTYHAPCTFSADTRQLLQILANQVAVAIVNNQMFEDLNRTATTDPLTGLANHRAFHARLDEEMKRARRSGKEVSVVMMDVDGFKLFNDTYGHPVGDQVLKAVADLLAENARGSDVLTRYGGDEFAAILPETGAKGAIVQAERLRSAMAERAFAAPDGTAIPIRMSFGIASYPHTARNAQELVGFADANLYESKAQGGGGITVAGRSVRSKVVEEGNFGVLDGLVTAVDHKDRYTRRHSEQVTTYALQMAEAMGLSEETQRTLRIAGLLHDVGKIGVPDEILRKPGRLEEGEFQVIKQHPLLGELIIKEVPNLPDVLDAVGSHHERVDGQGYPRGLAGQDIPLLGRILAVADSYSAMTTDRPYRKAMSPEAARADLHRVAGTQLDAKLVAIFLQVCQSEEASQTVLAPASREPGNVTLFPSRAPDEAVSL